MSWQQTLERHHVEWFPLAPDRIRVEAPSGAGQDFDLVQLSGPLYPSDAARLLERAARPTLLAADSAGAATAEMVEAAGHSLVTGDGWVLLRLGTETLRVDAAKPVHAPRPRGPQPWGRLRVARRLLEVRRPLTQTEIGQLAGLSQDRVSRVLGPLRRLRLVTRTDAGETVPDREALLAWWLGAYPRDAALAAHYYAADPLPEQLDRAVAAHQGRRLALSGDLAADTVAPWRIPRRVLLYSAAPTDLSTAGFVAAGAKEATLSVVTSPDPGVFMPARPDHPPRHHDDEQQQHEDEQQHEDDHGQQHGHAHGQPLERLGGWDVDRTGLVELADPLQVLLDVTDEAGPDAAAAAAVLRLEIISGKAGAAIAHWLNHALARDARAAVGAMPGGQPAQEPQPDPTP